MSDRTSDKNEAPGVATKSFFRRWWWAIGLVVSLVMVAICVPVLLLVAVPKIAQGKMNDANLSIQGIQITSARADSYNMAIQSTIKADSSIKATIDPFNGTMYLADVRPPLAVATIKFPQTNTSAVQHVNLSQEVQIEDLAAFTKFNEYLIANKTVHVRVKGDTAVHVSGISRAYGVHFDKTIELVGLNGFEGLVVTNPQINLDPENNFNGTTIIPNPSILSLDIGNVTFTNYLNGQKVGTTTIKNLNLRPGNNTFFTTATIDQLPVVDALTTEPFCQLNGKLPIDLTGSDVTSDGQLIPYFCDSLASRNQTVVIDLSEAAPAIGIPIGCVVPDDDGGDGDDVGDDTGSDDTTGGDDTVPADDDTTPGDDTTVPGDDATVPGDDTTVPGDDTTVPGDDATVPEDDATAPSDDATAPNDDTAAPSDDAALGDDTTVPGDDATTEPESGSQDLPSESDDKPTESDDTVAEGN